MKILQGYLKHTFLLSLMAERVCEIGHFYFILTNVLTYAALLLTGEDESQHEHHRGAVVTQYKYESKEGAQAGSIHNRNGLI